MYKHDAYPKEGFGMINDYLDILPTIEYFNERECMPTWYIKEDITTFYDITYVIDGTSTYVVDEIDIILESGDVIYVPKGVKRRAFTDADNPMHCFAFNFQYRFVDGGFRELPLPRKFHIGIEHNLIELLERFKFVWLEKKEGYILEARGLFLLILHRLMENYLNINNTTIHGKRINNVKKYILENFHTQIKIQELADLVHLHPGYLGKIFKDEVGYTINEFINRIRINKACDLLASGETVFETAYQCGFSDPFYFSKVFKRMKGIPPSEFTARNRTRD